MMAYKTREERREHYRKNKDKINETRRKYRKNNRDKVNEQQAKWRENNIEKVRKCVRNAKIKYEKKRKKEVFEHYGSKCACCGETIKEFLTIDHINGKGTKHRKRINGEKIYVWLFKNNFPKGFQTLCFNCNWGKYINNGVCPHKKIL